VREHIRTRSARTRGVRPSTARSELKRTASRLDPPLSAAARLRPPPRTRRRLRRVRAVQRYGDPRCSGGGFWNGLQAVRGSNAEPECRSQMVAGRQTRPRRKQLRAGLRMSSCDLPRWMARGWVAVSRRRATAT
jgi:hypothetical protein